MRFTALRLRRRAKPSPGPGTFLRIVAARLGWLACLCVLAVPLGAAPGAAATTAAPLWAAAPRYVVWGRHVRYVVEVNAKGQVSKVRVRGHSGDRRFDAVTYGNVVQMFVRTKDGRSIAGVYRVSYDISPKTHLVQRHVRLLSAGGVDAWALGLVDVYKQIGDAKAAEMNAALGKVHLATPKPTQMP